MPATKPKFGNAMVGRHLGRRPATDEQRRKLIPLRNFVKLEGRPVPATDDYASGAQEALTKMMDNDAEGCCVATALAKILGVMNAYRPGGKVLVATDVEVSKFYHAVGGPGDNGLYMPDAFNFAVQRGFTIGGVAHKLDGFCSIDNTDDALVDAAFHWFGGLQLGVALSMRQYQHAEDSDLWDIDNTATVGGHAVPLTKRGGDRLTLATWARQPQMTRRLLRDRSWCDECYVVMGPDWFDATGLDVNKLNVEALRAAFAAVKAGGTPDIPPDPNPPGPPVPPVPGDWTWEHTWHFNTFLGELLVHLGVKVGSAPMASAAANWWHALQDVYALARAIYAKNWTAAADAALQLLADLGITLPAERREAVAGVLRGMVGDGVTLPERLFHNHAIDTRGKDGYSE